MSNEMTIVAQNMTREDKGSYDLVFYATYRNATDEFTAEYTFKLIIFDD